MKVLLINHFPLQGSGSGVYVANIAKSLKQKGHEACIITPENTSHFSDLKDIKLHPVFFKYQEKIEGQLDFNFGCIDPHPRSSLLFGNMTDLQLQQYKEAFRKAIEEEIREFKPDIIHAQHIWIISEIALKYNIPVVVTSHGSDIMGYEAWSKFHPIMNEVVKKCKKIVAISDNNKELITNIFKESKQKVVVIPNGYNENVFYKENYNRQEVLKEFKINKNYNKIVCFSGRLAQNKGVDLLLQSAKKYGSEDVLTLIVGAGEELESLRKMQEELKLENVVFLGNQDHNTLRKIYNISDVCAVPSRKEAFGLVVIEAVACGTPVVATNRGGIPNILNDSIGILVEGENVTELGNAISKILNNEIKFDSNYLAEYAKNNYKQDLFIDKLIEIYKESLRGELNMNVELRNGIHMPIIGFGTSLIEGEECVLNIRQALEAGYRHIDTASVYKNESYIGKAIKESKIPREDIFITSKVWKDSMGYEDTIKSFNNSLKNLDLEYIDLFLIHWPRNNDKQLNIETWKALEDLYKQKKVRAIGLSNFLKHHLEIILNNCEIVPMVDQIEFHPGLMREETIEFCKEKNIVVEAWAPLGKGKMLQNEDLIRISNKYNKSVAQICIKWCLQNDVVPLPKTTNWNRMLQNKDIFDFTISDEDMKFINNMEFFAGSDMDPNKS